MDLAQNLLPFLPDLERWYEAKLYHVPHAKPRLYIFEDGRWQVDQDSLWTSHMEIPSRDRTYIVQKKTKPEQQPTPPWISINSFILIFWVENELKWVYLR